MSAPQDHHSVYQYWKRTTRNSDEHAESLTDWDQTYNQLSAGRFEGTIVDMWFDGIQIFRETTNRSVVQSGVPWESAYVIGTPLAMNGTGLFSKQLLQPDSIFTFKSDNGFSLRTPENFDVVGVAISDSVFAELMPQESDVDLRRAFTEQPTVFMPPKELMAELHDCLQTIFDPASFEPSLLQYRQVQRSMRSAIIGHLLEVLQVATHAPAPSPSFKSRCHVVERAVDYALANTDEPVTVSDLCAKTNVSRRMLNLCFQDVLDTNPVQYLRSMRLNGVRRELREARKGGEISVRDAACKWGFWHFSRFAEEYRALFGELPSETLKAARAHN